MPHRKAIERALTEIHQAQALNTQAAQKYINARRHLEELFANVQPRRSPNVLTDKEITRLLEKRPRK